MASNSRNSCYAKHPPSRQYNNDHWENEDHFESNMGKHGRGAADDDSPTPPQSTLGFGCRHGNQSLDDDNESNFNAEDVSFRSKYQGYQHCASSSYLDEGERSLGRSNDGGSDFARGNRSSAGGCYDGINYAQRGRQENHPNDAWEEGSSKENHGRNANVSDNYYHDANGLACVGVKRDGGRFHDKRSEESFSYSDDEQSIHQKHNISSTRSQQVRRKIHVDEKMARRPLQQRPHSVLYSSGDEQYFRDNDGYCHDPNGTGVINRKGWPLDGIDFNQIQCPHSMLFDQDRNNYDGDDEHQYMEPEAPIKEVSFVQEHLDTVKYHRNGRSFGNALSKHKNDGADSSLGDDYSDVCDDDEHQHTPKYKKEPIFFSSDSLNVIQRIESVMGNLFKLIDRIEEPVLHGYVNPNLHDDEDDSDAECDAVNLFMNTAKSSGDTKFYRNFGNIAQCRSFTSICLVMSFIHQLLLSIRTTTTREVYYVFVTHFRNQRECDGVILDVAKILGVSRRSLGLSASPKGWFCGCVEITRKGNLPSGKDVSGSIDGTALSSIQGLPITREWIERDEAGCTEDGVEIKVSSKNSKVVILVIEKEGVYNRLSEERIFDRFPCILVTGKGFPDLATRALVNTLHRELESPVIGLCDCNPYGISVLSVYHCAGDRMGVDGRARYSVPIQWLGLRPSEVVRLKGDLPETVFQKLTELDNKRIASLLDKDHSFLAEEDVDEVRDMGDAGYKVELEALYWLGPDYMGNWVLKMLKDEYEHSFEE